MFKRLFGSYFFRSTAIYALSSAFTSALPILLMPILTRYMIPSDYGTLGLMSMAINITSALTGLSVHGAISRQYFDRDKIDFSEYVSNCLFILLISSVVVGVLITFFSKLIISFIPIPFWWLYSILIVSVGQFLVVVRLVLWQVSLLPQNFLWLRILQATLLLGLTLLLVVQWNMGWRGSIAAQEIVFVILALFSLGSIWKEGLIKFSINKSYLRHALFFSLPLIPIELGGIALATADSFIVSKMLGIAEAGIYVAGAQIGTGLLLITSAVNKAWVPWLFGKLKSQDYEVRKQIVKITYGYNFLLFVLAAILSVTAPFVGSILLNQKYQAVVKLIPWIAFGAAFQGMYFMVCNYFYYIHKTYLLAIIFVMVSVFNIGTIFLFIRWAGLQGAAMGTMLSYLFCYFLTFAVAAKIFKMPWGLKLEKNS